MRVVYLTYCGSQRVHSLGDDTLSINEQKCFINIFRIETEIICLFVWFTVSKYSVPAATNQPPLPVIVLRAFLTIKFTCTLDLLTCNDFVT